MYAYLGSKLIINAEGLGFQYLYESDEILGEAINAPTTKEQIIKQFSRLNDTIAITSYSIHYTKLYDSILRKIRCEACPGGLGAAVGEVRRPAHQMDVVGLCVAVGPVIR